MTAIASWPFPHGLLCGVENAEQVLRVISGVPE